MWIMWKMWINKMPASLTAVKASADTGKNALTHKNPEIKYPQFFFIHTAAKNCGYVERLNSEEVFPDFMDIPGTHSYQQISGCAIFQ